jgi:phosphoglycolate phosphatase
MDRIELIIFDLDGTLLDTLPDVHQCINLALANMNLPPISEKQAKIAIGPGPEHFARIALGESNKNLLEKFFQIFRPIYHEKCFERTRPFPGISELLINLYGYRLAVASNKRLSFTARILHGLNLESHFSLIVDPELAGEAKPSPKMVDYVLKHLKTMPGHALLVGDTENDLLAAKAAGVKSCAVGWGYSELHSLASHNPDYSINTPSELLNILEQYKYQTNKKVLKKSAT